MYMYLLAQKTNDKMISTSITGQKYTCTLRSREFEQDKYSVICRGKAMNIIRKMCSILGDKDAAYVCETSLFTNIT